MMHLTGLGKMRPNTVVIGFKNNWTDKRYRNDLLDYLGVIYDAFELNFGLVILRMNGKEKTECIAEEADDESEDETSSVFDLEEDECSKPEPLMQPKEDTEEELNRHTNHDQGFREPFDNGPNLHRIKIALKEKQTGTIDVWWLYDDGGLTVLIPYLLTLHRTWKNCKLRFFSADIRSKHGGLSGKGLRMASLLKKFRIDASCVEQVNEVNKMPSEDSIASFRSLPVGEELGDAQIKDQKILRTIRIGELIRRNCSQDTRLVVITIPVPAHDVTTPLMYMSWLEVLSSDLPPVLLVRGNQTNVLTFYS